jgi:ribosomal protein L11 methyltransferase
MARPARRSRSRGAAWLEASLRVPCAAADRLGTLLVEAGSHGVVTGVHELGRGRRRRTHEVVRGFFPAREPVKARLAVRAALNRLEDPALARLAVGWRELDARLWEMDWREHFQPVVAGRSLVVVPPWNRAAFPGRRRIVVHPGMAFGTGQHATTHACLEAIERLTSPPPAAALDVGTGTGVLAIALAKRGVGRVVAIDTDPQAIAAARANLRRNAVARRVRLSTRPLARRAATGAFPLAVANLYVDALVGLEPTLAHAVAPGGRLVTSGVLRAQQRRLRGAFVPARWRLCETLRRGTWVTTIFARRPAGRRR